MDKHTVNWIESQIPKEAPRFTSGADPVRPQIYLPDNGRDTPPQIAPEEAFKEGVQFIMNKLPVPILRVMAGIDTGPLGESEIEDINKWSQTLDLSDKDPKELYGRKCKVEYLEIKLMSENRN